VQLDTYNREIERYQANYMELSESFFFFDSRMFLNAFAQLNLEEDEGELRMLYALENVEGWFNTFQLSLHQRVSLVQAAAGGLGEEFDSGVKIELDQQYRTQRRRIQQAAIPQCLKSLLDCRLEEVRTEAAGYSAGRLLDNLPHYLHMSLNRWFATDQRLQEFTVYYFLQKRYAEKLKRTST
jgi:thiopeptide-type bacteriocin biosynthesis protein